MSLPDRLENSLIRMRNGQGQRRVIRDDGTNGLWISNPNTPSSMYHIDRQEFEENWELQVSSDAQRTEDISATIFGQEGPTPENRVMNLEDGTNVLQREEHPVEARKNEGFDGGRSEPTDREAMAREILGSPVLDADFSGDPVAANEESVSTFEEDRAMGEGDAEAAEQREEELSGQFETHEAPDAQLEDVGDEENADEGEDAPKDEPTAGNEDPDDADSAANARAEGKGQPKASKRGRKANKG